MPLFRRSLRPLWVLTLALAVLLALAPSAGPAARGQDTPVQAAQLAAISPQLEAQLVAGRPVSFLVILADQLDVAAAAQPSVEATGQKARGQALYAALTQYAARSQAPLRAWLDAHGVPYRPFYIVNMIEVQGDASLAATLRSFATVDRLAANPAVAGIGPQPEVDAAQRTDLSALPYGLTYTHAPEVWAIGYRGQGIVVASQDTGVEWDHPALVAHYRGWDAASGTADHVYNWYDAWGEDHPCSGSPQVPCDDNGHGTHTVGTMVGDGTPDGRPILGMAPEAKWIGCRNMYPNITYGWVGSPASYAACFQFMLAPYPQGGDPFTDGRPDLAPNIINNSWSCPPGEGCDVSSLRQVVETARAAGQLVVASAGNYGSACSTVQYPIGMHDAVFTVGAHDSAGQLAGFSSRGPVTSDGSNRLKPDLTAPGVGVYSADLDSSYSTKSGTSMSSPHVAGAAALLWSAVPTLVGEIDLTEQVLIKSATPVPNTECLPAGPAITPNPAYGYGRLNVLQAVQMAQDPWRAVISVKDAQGQPVSGASVTIRDEATGFTYSGVSSSKGSVRISRLYWGQYTLSVTRGGEEPVSTSFEIDVAGGSFTRSITAENLAMTYRISGQKVYIMYFPLFFPP